jgi:hypothetical protein
MVEGQVYLEAARSRLEDTYTFGHYFGADTVAGNDCYAVGHEKTPSSCWKV